MISLSSVISYASVPYFWIKTGEKVCGYANSAKWPGILLNGVFKSILKESVWVRELGASVVLTMRLVKVIEAQKDLNQTWQVWKDVWVNQNQVQMTLKPSAWSAIYWIRYLRKRAVHLLEVSGKLVLRVGALAMAAFSFLELSLADKSKKRELVGESLGMDLLKIGLKVGEIQRQRSVIQENAQLARKWFVEVIPTQDTEQVLTFLEGVAGKFEKVKEIGMQFIPAEPIAFTQEYLPAEPLPPLSEYMVTKGAALG